MNYYYSVSRELVDEKTLAVSGVTVNSQRLEILLRPKNLGMQ